MQNVWVVTFQFITDGGDTVLRSFEVEAGSPDEARDTVYDILRKRDTVTPEALVRQNIKWGHIHGPFIPIERIVE